MPGSVDLSIIIVSWNVRDLLERCLASIQRERGLRVEVIVVDNASGDGTADRVRSSFPEVRLIANTTNAGFAAANNQGLRVATGRHLLLLNPDTEVGEGTLKRTVEELDAHSDIGTLGCRILNPDGSLQRSVRLFPSVQDQALVLLKFHALFPQLSAIRRYTAQDHDYNHSADVDQVMGAYLAFPRTVLEKVGDLDEGYYLWFEEVDFCYRVRQAGYRVRYLADVSIVHHGAQSFGQLQSLAQQRILNRSMLRYARKHFRPAGYLLLLVLYPVSMVLAALEQLFLPRYAAHPVR